MDVDGLTGAILKDFRVWRASGSADVIKFSVEKDKERGGIPADDGSVARTAHSWGEACRAQVTCGQSGLG